MTDLLDLVLTAHGGHDRWRQARTIHARAAVGGLLWGSRGQEGIFARARITADVQRQHLIYSDFTGPGLRGIYTPDRVAIEDHDGHILQERRAPREVFAGHDGTTAWDRLHALYFGGYAMWNYVTTPYLLTRPGTRGEELEPWQEAGERWRRLRVMFPDDIATHNTEQDFYYDRSGLLRRHDYRAQVPGAPAVAHYTDGHLAVSGLVFPTRRSVVPVQEDGRPLTGSVLVTIDLTDITVD
ncbi:hypothetical protein HEP87_55440 [Streptomyces sp. S1D4-11]|nr:hypothetical protein [Streptomyces sp. S1D4-11]QIZ01174.1 hypothetical protein HEP87_55440 [Streptomyces sp. S1D4-11]